MDKATEQLLGLLLIFGFAIAYLAVIDLRSGYRVYKGKRIEAPVLAAVAAYVYYVGAALLAGAKLPGFLREHLFDGLAPAAVVGLLVNTIPRERPREALPWIRRPVMVLVALFAGGALVCGLIAAAAVFSSGSDAFGAPVAVCAWGGGLLFAGSYWSAAGEDVDVSDRWWGKVKWWFTKRPERAATPGPGGPDSAATPPAADVAEGAAVPDWLRAAAARSAAGRSGGARPPAHPLKGDPPAGTGGRSH